MNVWLTVLLETIKFHRVFNALNVMTLVYSVTPQRWIVRSAKTTQELTIIIITTSVLLYVRKAFGVIGKIILASRANQSAQAALITSQTHATNAETYQEGMLRSLDFILSTGQRFAQNSVRTGSIKTLLRINADFATLIVLLAMS